MQTREQFIDEMKRARPSLKLTSIKSYMSKLEVINKAIGSENTLDLNVLLEPDVVFEFLSDKKPNTKKTYLGCIVCLLVAFNKGSDELLKTYRNTLEDLQKGVETDMAKQEKSKKQEENWASIEALRQIIDNYLNLINEGRLWSKPDLTQKEFQLIQKYVVGMLYLGDIENNPPLRLDYAPMKVVHITEYNKIDHPTQNMLVITNRDNMFFELVDYKTESTYGVKKIEVGDTLRKVLNKWLKINPSGSLLLNLKGKPMTANDLSKFINLVFKPSGKKIGATMLRHIVISELFPARLEESEKTANLMLHSTNTQTLYSKKI
jgi:hypothetical protein